MMNTLPSFIQPMKTNVSANVNVNLSNSKAKYSNLILLDINFMPTTHCCISIQIMMRVPDFIPLVQLII